MVARSENDLIREQVQRIVASGVLGRSRFYAALLEYLADCGERGHAPKEIEIAAAVFSRGDEFDPTQDSMVRVYAHNLRQKLEQYYADQGSGEADQIRVPKGEYRIVVGPDREAPDVVQARSALPGAFRIALIVAVSLIAGVVVDRALVSDASPAADKWLGIAHSGLWAGVTEDDTPITIVVGDYYIFGELDEYGDVGRMVREFSVNSRQDLDELFMASPEMAERYVDLDLTYLPSSIAYAMRDVVSVLSATGKEIRVVSMSNLESSVIRESHVVYVGYLSGLGMLNDFAFESSELAVGETYDVLIHWPTGKSYISEAGMPNGQQSYRDYGLFETLPAPGGNRFVFIAGTRDEGLMQTARAVSDPRTVEASLAAVTEDGQLPDAFELLYEVAGLGRTNLDAVIVHAAALDTGRVAVGQLTP